MPKSNRNQRNIDSANKALTIASLFLLAIAVICLLGILPLALLWLYLGASLLSFAVYALDKAAAQRGGRRTPENTLHMLALVGGWPGAMVAQQRLRHKTKKESFRLVFWITVVLNLVALGAVLAGYSEWLVEILERLSG